MRLNSSISADIGSVVRKSSAVTPTRMVPLFDGLGICINRSGGNFNGIY